MKIAGRNLLDDFCAKHADARPWIENWLADAEAAKWATPQDIKNRYSSASFLDNNTVVFNVKGNRYRLEVTCAYQVRVVFVKWVGTHSDYDSRNSRR